LCPRKAFTERHNDIAYGPGEAGQSPDRQVIENWQGSDARGDESTISSLARVCDPSENAADVIAQAFQAKADPDGNPLQRQK